VDIDKKTPVNTSLVLDKIHPTINPIGVTEEKHNIIWKLVF
jgi:hypothetical protein